MSDKCPQCGQDIPAAEYLPVEFRPGGVAYDATWEALSSYVDTIDPDRNVVRPDVIASATDTVMRALAPIYRQAIGE